MITINVDNIKSDKKRTNLILNIIKNNGYVLSFNELTQFMKTKLPPNKLKIFINYVQKRHIASILEMNNKFPLNVNSYNIIKIDNDICGFYISRIKLNYGGLPEIRLIIENEEEFEILWLKNFVFGIINTNLVLLGKREAK